MGSQTPAFEVAANADGFIIRLPLSALMAPAVIRTGDVFVAGGQPTVTYNPRADLRLERDIRNYLETRYKILSVSGPTKSGKTVLTQSIVPRNQGVWVSGGQVDSIDKFWEIILDQVGAFTDHSQSVAKEESSSAGGSAGGQFGVVVAQAQAAASFEKQAGETATQSRARSVSSATAALKALQRGNRPLIVDDFHYIGPDVQDRIIRALKDPVFGGLPVILISVPHRAFDAVRVEREMTGRVAHVQVPLWKPEELGEIARRGFETLKLIPAEGLVPRLVAEAFSSPHLMQDFCGELCREVGIYESRAVVTELRAPEWDTFFRSKAGETAKREFERLRQGPRERTDRKMRTLRNGQQCDIYTGVLLAIATAGPPTQITTREVRKVLQEIMTEGVPEGHEITRVMEQMSSIASERIMGEPVVDWDKDFGILHITDPFFAFYLRWGTELP